MSTFAESGNEEMPAGLLQGGRKVDVRLPGKENPNSHGARPVYQIISMLEWIRTSRLSIRNSLVDTLLAASSTFTAFEVTI